MPDLVQGFAMRALFRLDSLHPFLQPRWICEADDDSYQVSTAIRPAGDLGNSQRVKRVDLDSYLAANLPEYIKTELVLDVGAFHPRIWRGDHNPDPREFFAPEWAMSWGGIATLVRRMQEIFRHVEPCSDNLRAYGHEIRQLLILAATETESSLRAVLRANGYEQKGQWSTRDYVKLLKPMHLAEWELSLQGYPLLPPVAPFNSWDVDAPTQTLPWYEAYNDVKHDRERAFPKATLAHAITATAAAFAVFVAQFGEPDERRGDGLGDFHVTKRSTFTLREQYVPPYLAGTAALSWTPVLLAW